jgi:ketosteroid isomerase-like protein
MTRTVLIAASLLGTGLVFASTSEQEKEVASIHKAHADFIAAFNAGNLDRAFGFLTEDFVALVERQPTMNKAAYRALVAPFVAANQTAFSFEVDETVVSGEWAFERIRYSGTITSKAGGEMSPVSWRAIAIWKRLPDGWKVARYIRTPDPPRSPAQ